MTIDLHSPTSIAIRARLRQAPIWMASLLFVVLYFFASLIHVRASGARVETSRELVDVLLLLSWSTAALGFRPSLRERFSHGSVSASFDLRASRPIAVAVAVGVALADSLVVVLGATVLANLGRIRSPSMGELGLGVLVAATVGVAASLQMEIARTLGKRSAVLIVTGLLTIATLHAAHADLPAPVAFLGRLVFPVSTLVSATEEPLRLDLAARALSAGVTYDLALIATLLALPGHRARGQT